MFLPHDAPYGDRSVIERKPMMCSADWIVEYWETYPLRWFCMCC